MDLSFCGCNLLRLGLLEPAQICDQQDCAVLVPQMLAGLGSLGMSNCYRQVML